MNHAAEAASELRTHHRLRELDGLRGWAALVVVIFHFTWEMFGAQLPVLRSHLPGPLNDGHLAVSVFFVLSGIALSIAFVRRRQLGSIAALALRRYPRLTIPILVTSLLTWAMMSSGLLYSDPAAQVLGRADWLGRFYWHPPSLTAALSFATFHVYADYNTSPNYGVFLWTMRYEMAGSMLVFGLLALSMALGRIWHHIRFPLLLIIAAACLLTAPLLACFVAGLLLSELLASGVLARAFAGGRGNLVGLFALALGISGSVVYRGHPGLPGLIAATAIVLVPLCSPAARALLNRRFSQWLGHISFPLYLTHSLVLCGPMSAAVVLLEKWEIGMVSIAAMIVPMAVTISLLVAWLFTPIEDFAVAASRRFSDGVLRSHLARHTLAMLERKLGSVSA
ncbi:acyltransferase family protein [Muricoccus aerilatus]|uniref:acyltransferase family protein n=1 Tax=Muricoccus aerilatus TaxID=452982 RepID=UPI0014705868|nr:acyltransferase [Roseomonas aerilata]